MKAASLLAQLRKRGIKFSLRGDDIVYRAPKGVITSELLETFKTKKQSIVDELRSETEPTESGIDHLMQRAQQDDSDFLHQHPFGRIVEPIKSRLLSRVGLDKNYVRGKGCYLWDDTEKKYLDCIAQYGGLPFGYNPEPIWNAIQRVRENQLPSVATQSLLDSAGQLADRLLSITPSGFEHVIFCNSGTEATEVAIKLCRSATGRAGIASTRNGFHGLTTGSLSVTGSDAFQNGFFVRCEDFQHIPFGDSDALTDILAHSPKKFAAFVVEPIQGEAGIIVPPQGYLTRVREICDRFDVLMVVDEVQTGLGRTGRMFACEHEGVIPDVITLAKALGGGLMPSGAVLCRPVAYSIRFGLRHSSTFAGNAMAAECGLATLDVLTANQSSLIRNVEATGQYLQQRLNDLKARHSELIHDVRGQGLMQAIEFHFQPLQDRNGLLPILVDQQLLLHLMISYMLHVHQVRVAPTFMGRDVLRIEPALIAGRAECDHLLAALESSLAVVKSGNTAALATGMIEIDDDELKRVCAKNQVIENQRPQGVSPRLPTATPEASAYGSQQGTIDNIVGDFGFLVHLTGLSDLVDFDPSLAVFDRQQLAELKHELTRSSEPTTIGTTLFGSITGTGARGHFVLVPYTPTELLQMPQEKAIDQISQAAFVAKDSGVGLIGLGGFTSIITHGGIVLDAAALPPLTSGNSYTVATTLKAINDACHNRSVCLENATVAIVGAAGQIGRAISIILSESVSKLVLVGRDGMSQQTQRGLRNVTSDIAEYQFSQFVDSGAIAGPISERVSMFSKSDQGDAENRASRLSQCLLDDGLVLQATNVSEIAQADIVIAVSSAVEPFITGDYIKQGGIVCDSSRPANVCPLTIDSRPDVNWIEGGLVRIPGASQLDIFAGPRPDAAYACVAESVLWSLEPSLGRPSSRQLLDVETIRALEVAGIQHGFE